MSSTNRGSRRRDYDYYKTPIKEIEKFLISFHSNLFIIMGNDVKILDPCAGGSKKDNMSYPQAYKNLGWQNKIDTIDIREDSKADIIGDYLNIDCKNKYDIIITNPPFDISLEIIKKALQDVKENGYVIMLQRLNFLGSKKRFNFWQENMPNYIFVHHKRMSFIEGKGTDSIEYAHYVWQKGWKVDSSKLYLI